MEVAHEAGLIGRKRVLDSTALYDAVATQDTVTVIRSAICALLRSVNEKLGEELRACCKRDDDYIAPGKPSCDWEDVQAREALVDALASDAYAILAILDGRTLTSEVMQAVKLVATVVGQDLEQRNDGMFRIAHRVAKDRVISTVDPEARHGHKTAARGFDGYKGHIAIDPDSEIITATTVTAGNASDGSVADALVADVLAAPPAASPEGSVVEALVGEDLVADVLAETEGAAPSSGTESEFARATPTDEPQVAVRPTQAVASVEIYGDSSYGTAKFVDAIEGAGAEANVKVQPPSAPEGKFGKAAFEEGGRIVLAPQHEVVPAVRDDRPVEVEPVEVLALGRLGKRQDHGRAGRQRCQLVDIDDELGRRVVGTQPQVHLAQPCRRRVVDQGQDALLRQLDRDG